LEAANEKKSQSYSKFKHQIGKIIISSFVGFMSDELCGLLTSVAINEAMAQAHQEIFRNSLSWIVIQEINLMVHVAFTPTGTL